MQLTQLVDASGYSVERGRAFATAHHKRLCIPG